MELSVDIPREMESVDGIEGMQKKQFRWKPGRLFLVEVCRSKLLLF